jgi:hypothetical protein
VAAAEQICKQIFLGIFVEYNFADFTVFEEDKVVLNFGQSVLTRRAGFALRFSELDKIYRTEICLSCVDDSSLIFCVSAAYNFLS